NPGPAAAPGAGSPAAALPAVKPTPPYTPMNAAGSDLPWRLSFSYGRALQEPALRAWAGDAANVGSAQRQLALRARLNGAATLGQYRGETEAA
ncbi:MAG: fructose-bisphosphate aldolase class I, partial [Gammaproteobacteria bacterium]|nr:fructose-bisphosphate aldolase class I [Gammaproteobacteria bacterium]